MAHCTKNIVKITYALAHSLVPLRQCRENIQSMRISMWHKHCQNLHTCCQKRYCPDLLYYNHALYDAQLHKNYLSAITDLIDLRHRPDGIYKWVGHHMNHWSKYHVLFPLARKSAAEVGFGLQNLVFAYLGVP